MGGQRFDLLRGTFFVLDQYNFPLLLLVVGMDVRMVHVLCERYVEAFFKCRIGMSTLEFFNEDHKFHLSFNTVDRRVVGNSVDDVFNRSIVVRIVCCDLRF